jgi:hypothetical protein
MKQPYMMKHKADVIRLLDQHCDGDGEIASYRDGWSDRRISLETNVEVKNVTNMRSLLKGRIYKHKKTPDGDLFPGLHQLQQQAADMMDLRARLVRLEREVAELRARA